MSILPYLAIYAALSLGALLVWFRWFEHRDEGPLRRGGQRGL